MPLRSRAFADDTALQACLVRDSAHVLQGAHGDHVAKIQKALFVLDDARIALGELMTKSYGPSTSTAVLAYKRQRDIVNRSYQSTADNIVGKMTIARLDEEMIEVERQQSAHNSVCDGTSGPVPLHQRRGVRPFAVTGPTPPRLRRHGKLLNLVWQETAGAVEFGGSVNHAFHFVRRARELLQPHGIDFAVTDSALFAVTVGPQVPDWERVVSGSSTSCFSVRASAERVLKTSPNVLRVIAAPFQDNETDIVNGVTDGGAVHDWDFPKFVIINVRKLNPDHGTLLHEIVHAAYKLKLDHDTDLTSVFAKAVIPRTHLPAHHAAQIADSFFASPRLFPF